MICLILVYFTNPFRLSSKSAPARSTNAAGAASIVIRKGRIGSFAGVVTLKSLRTLACGIAAWVILALPLSAVAVDANPVKVRLVLTHARTHAAALQVNDSAVTLAREGELVAFGDLRLRVCNVRPDSAAIELAFPLAGSAPQVILLSTGDVFEYRPTAANTTVTAAVAPAATSRRNPSGRTAK
jgi:hypothetical protein